MGNMFQNAVKVLPPRTGRNKKVKETTPIEGLETFAALGAVIDSLEALRASLEYSIKATMMDLFRARGADTQRRPANFEGREGIASASCELRKRSTRSKLDDDTRALLNDHGVETELVTSVIDTYIVNPDYMANGRLLARVAKALEKVPGIPADFIQHQVGASYHVIGEDALSQVFAGDPEMIETLLPVVGVPAIKAKIADGRMDRARAIVAALLRDE